MIGDEIFFFIYPKVDNMSKAKNSTELRDSNDLDGNFHRFNLSTKALNKKRSLKIKRQKKFLQKFYLKNGNKDNEILGESKIRLLKGNSTTSNVSCPKSKNFENLSGLKTVLEKNFK